MYQDKLSQLDHYKKFPEMLPFIGKMYENAPKKVLVIGESHYLPNEVTTMHREPKHWYSLAQIPLTKDEKKHINTAGNIRGWISGNERCNAYTIYQNIEKALREKAFGGKDAENYLEYISFYNYFQRPAEAKVSIRNDELDNNYAFEHFHKVWSFLNVDTVIFTSKRAARAYQDCQSKNPAAAPRLVHQTCHPACSWWNRKHRSWVDGELYEMTGKEVFWEGLSR
jgi:hypothetical protein